MVIIGKDARVSSRFWMLVMAGLAVCGGLIPAAATPAIVRYPSHTVGQFGGTEIAAIVEP